MRTTFLGHQGWLVESADFRLLIDPILCPFFRNTPTSRIWLYPPRSIDMQALGRIDAVYITHEHEDHFHIESLNRLDRRTGIWLSANVTSAAERILREMGFPEVRRLFAMQTVDLGRSLKLFVLPPPAAKTEHWVLQPFVLGERPGESFYNLVDCSVSPQLPEFLRKHRLSTLGLVCVANNAQITEAPFDLLSYKPTRRTLGHAFHPAAVLQCHHELRTLPPVQHVAIVGGGFIDEGNPYGRFWKDAAAVANTLQQFCLGSVRVFGPSPGEATELGPAAAASPPAAPSFIRPCPEAQALLDRAREHRFEPSPFGYEYRPATGRGSLTPAELEELPARLEGLAKRLSAHPITAEMFLQNLADDGNALGLGRLMLILLDSANGSRCFEYQPASQSFVPMTVSGPEFLMAHKYPFGYECWASDFLDLLRGKLHIFEILFFRNRYWSPARSLTIGTHFAAVLNDLYSPEVDVQATYTMYARAYSRCGGEVREGVPG